MPAVNPASFMYGALADRPTASAHLAGCWFFVSDAADKRWTFCDGAAWYDCGVAASYLSGGSGGGPHASSHQPGGNDTMAVDAAAEVGSLRTIGAGAQQACAGNDTRLSDARAPTAHTHPQSAITNLESDLAGKAASSHSHAQSDVTNLVSDLAGKAAASHTHAAADIASGTVATARLGSGTADATTFLRGDQTWAAPAGGGESETVVRKTGDTANATTNMADAAGLTFTPEANKDYIIEAFILYDTSNVAVGIKLSATGPASPTAMAGHWLTNAANGTVDGAAFNANDVTVTTAAAPFTTANIANLWCVLRNGANSTAFTVRFAAETTGTITVKAGSCLRYRKIN